MGSEGKYHGHNAGSGTGKSFVRACIEAFQGGRLRVLCVGTRLLLPMFWSCAPCLGFAMGMEGSRRESQRGNRGNMGL